MKRLVAPSLSAAVGVGLASFGYAGITASWRVNPITPAAIAAEPSLANAISVSLLVNLTGPSLFNVAGLDLTGLLPGVTIYNNSFGANSNAPNPALVGVFPALAFDTYVCGSDPATNASTPVSIPFMCELCGPQFGPDRFKVAWGATPNTGPLNGSNLEIARITFLNAVPGFTALEGPVRAQVRSSDDPNTAVGVPPIPVAVPEPAAVFLGGASFVLARRSRAGCPSSSAE